MSETEAKIVTFSSNEHIKQDEKGKKYIELRLLPVLDRPMTMRVSSRKAQNVSPTRRKIRDEAREIALSSRTTKAFLLQLHNRCIPLTRHYKELGFNSWGDVGRDLKQDAGLRRLKARARNGDFPIN